MTPSCVVPGPIGSMETFIETFFILGTIANRRPVEERINLRGPRRRRGLVLHSKVRIACTTRCLGNLDQTFL